jgi:hypothetical protein
MPELRKGASVRVVKPRSFQGGTGRWSGRKARLKFVSASLRYVHLVFEGETDELWFFSDELEVIG